MAKLAAAGKTVGLATILVGDDPASVGYVRKKHEACEQVGMASIDIRISADSTQADLLTAVAQLNADPAVDGYLIQHPVPPGFDFNEAVGAIDPSKDADGLHPTNLGRLALGDPNAPRPCTPLGIKAMLAHYEVPVAGRNVVIVGRGPTLGRPLSMLLSLKEPGANAAVTSVHTGVPNWADYTRQADIVVGAAGSPNMITPGRDQGRLGRHRRRAHLGGAQGVLRRRRVLRRGGRLDHPSARGGRGHHHRHAPPQHRDGGRAPALSRFRGLSL